ncbi:uncharacterized protein NECHADRAFT_85540 [Fusarium vanettenii 77-13-4]|uniref:Uncharacterized protein n=1 Tax=Fusarium vanettenii (strain ATCC MYA-4622 / CBS 123669 / FGSC 9596 / NRRL 45880 / 77-13-4) TaxID=660122 RepID=C7ZNU0_FUSV7|nr:uncharacterized protein NECHADRAFT_85540 [Fusarium vanettenii 77-13-4]EEU34254.1 hypothetical protein NECHADRAFT_85540 [Fusarium vanettenii 77-13-4]
MSFGFGVGDFIAVLELVNKVRKDFRSAPSQFEDISKEVRSLSIVLSDVEVTASETELDAYQRSDLQHLVSSCQDVLETLEETLDKYRDLHSGNGKLRSRRLKTLDWLTPLDYAAQQQDFISRRQPGTGKWLLESKEYQSWLTTVGNTLFCPGMPGAGKTILTSTVVEDLTAKFLGDTNTAVAYIYFNFRRKDDQKLNNLLASILRQCIQHLNRLPDSVSALEGQCKGSSRRPSLDELLATLQSVSAGCSRLFIVVDALDECQASDGCRASLLSELFKLRARCGVNIFATSRFIPDIVDTFENGTTLEIRASSEDVERYVKGRMEHLQPFVRRNKQLQEEIKVGISAAVDGMFLLAQIFLDSLDDKLTPKGIRNGLKDLRKQIQGPGEAGQAQALDYAYEQALERINSQKPGLRNIALQVLAWITCAKRPLTQLELQHALAVEPDTTQFDEENLPDIQGMVSACCGLVTIENESSIIRLVHYTTQEYFERTQRTWFPEADAEITKTCLTYLSFDVFEAGALYGDEELIERLRSNPLYDYATQHWGHHARKAPTLTEKIIEFLESGRKVEAAGQALLCSTRYEPGSGTGGGTDPDGATGLHLAAYFDLDTVMRSLLESGSIDPNSAASFKWHGDMTALSYAAQMGHVAIVKLLLEKDSVDPDSKNAAQRNWGRTPLSYAAENGHESIVELLINTGRVNINAVDEIGSFDLFTWPGDGLTPLCAAAENGHLGAVKILLANGADPAYKHSYWEHGEDTETPLARATKSGHEAIAKLLLDRIKSNAESEK